MSEMSANLKAIVCAICCTLIVNAAHAQNLPEGDFYGEQEFSPTVEVLLAAGNGVLAAYNGYLFTRGFRRDLPAGLAVVTGAIAVSIGMRDGANYPAADLAFGTAAIVAGGAQLLFRRAWPGSFHLGNHELTVDAVPVSPASEAPVPGLRILITAR